MFPSLAGLIYTRDVEGRAEATAVLLSTDPPIHFRRTKKINWTSDLEH